MAFQAQYPSNILLFNRSGQEAHEFSLQQQSVFVDQSNMLFRNGSNNNDNNVNRMNDNSGRRGREVAAAITTPMNSFSLQMQMQTQPQPPQLIQLSQLHQPNVVSTGLRLAFADQQQNFQQTHHNQNHAYSQQQQLNLLSNSSAVFSSLSDNFVTQIKRHREELDQFLQTQGEELRRMLAEKRQRHYRQLLGAAEESVARRLREKEAEVEKAKRRNAELEARAAQVSAETLFWQAKTRAQEATATSLQAQLQQAIMNGGGVPNSRRGDEELNCTDGVERQTEDAESAYVDPERVVSSGPGCKACRTRVASVVLLPCRHLCLCRKCDTVAQACPLCHTVKNSSLEVFLS